MTLVGCALVILPKGADILHEPRGIFESIIHHSFSRFLYIPRPKLSNISKNVIDMGWSAHNKLTLILSTCGDWDDRRECRASSSPIPCEKCHGFRGIPIDPAFHYPVCHSNSEMTTDLGSIFFGSEV